ncbi:MAG: trypsin-like peptidase domain-containing protein [Phycisphaeraceae bacterium]|nr:trypsin-like peptidase domain-containing protein [Phycisphaeraceae bacterium]
MRILIVLTLIVGEAHGVTPWVSQEGGNLRRTAVVDVVEACRQAVVNVNTTTTIRQRFGPWGDDPFFRQFFGRSLERDVQRRSLGSGFIIHPAGYVVTNAHVVQDADQVQVNLADDRTLDARVLACDLEHDLAVLKIDPPDDELLQAVTLGDSSDLMQGEPVIAIGNPLGYHHSISAGIISATGRPLQVDSQRSLEGLIQTDAPINPGNSGGPLLNAYGQVIGINTAIRGDAQSIGFAIPVNNLRQLLPQLLSPLAVSRVELGGELYEQRTISPPARIETQLFWLDDKIARPAPLTAINGRPVRDIVEATVALLAVKPGDRIELSDGQGQPVQLMARAPKISDAQRLAQSILGLTPRPITAADRAGLKLGTATGLLIESIEASGPAAQAGLRQGDVLVQLGRYRINSLEDLAALLSQVRGGEQADLYVIRDQQLGRARLVLRAGKFE